MSDCKLCEGDVPRVWDDVLECYAHTSDEPGKLRVCERPWAAPPRDVPAFDRHPDGANDNGGTERSDASDEDRARRAVVAMCPRQLCRSEWQCMKERGYCRLRPPLDEIAQGGKR